MEDGEDERLSLGCDEEKEGEGGRLVGWEARLRQYWRGKETRCDFVRETVAEVAVAIVVVTETAAVPTGKGVYGAGV
jgi:hypothetical protein